MLAEETCLRVYRDTIRPLYAYVAKRAGGDRDLAEDVTQEAWLRALEAWRKKGLPREPIAWLKTTARKKRLTFRFAEANARRELTVIYFRPGLRWVPSYRIQIGDEQGLEGKAPVGRQFCS